MSSQVRSLKRAKSKQVKRITASKDVLNDMLACITLVCDELTVDQLTEIKKTLDIRPVTKYKMLRAIIAKGHTKLTAS